MLYTLKNIKPEGEPHFLVTPGLRITLVFLSWIVGTMLMLLLSAVLAKLLVNNQLGFLRISLIFQDILMWVVPAFATAMIITRNPAKLLAVDTLPSLKITILAVLSMIVSIPFMSWIIRLNADVTLPASLSALETSLRAMEENAERVVNTLLDVNSPGALIVNILIIGILAGFSEEIFFRGTLQRVLAGGKMSSGAAVWIAALIFSLMHFQFFGFIPRLLLGAFFGYLLLWSGSVWLPILIHTLNNTVYVICYSVTGSGDPDLGAASQTWVGITVSAVLTAACLYAMWRTKTCLRPTQSTA